MFEWFKLKRRNTFHLGLDEEKTASKVFCMLPWTHMHVLPNADVLPCCITDYQETLGNLSKSKMKSIWNGDKMKELRLNMLNEAKTPTCSRCYELEEHGAISLRQQVNETLADSYQMVAKTKKDGALSTFEMHYLDIRFSNLCNLKCQGCSPALSSKWAEDYSKLYDIEMKESSLLKVDRHCSSFWQQLEPQLKHVKRAYFAGGEPLMMDEHYRCLESFIANKQTDIPISYNTNLSVLGNKNYKVLDFWPLFKHVFLSVSVDDIEERGEYYRFGMKWDQLIKNLEKVRTLCPSITVEIMCTVNIFNIFRLPEIHKYFIDKGIVHEDNFYMNYLLNPESLKTCNLSLEMKKVVRSKLELYLDDINSNGKDWSKFASDVQAQLDFMDEPSLEVDRLEFKRRVELLDKMRGTHANAVYPELSFVLESPTARGAY